MRRVLSIAFRVLTIALYFTESLLQETQNEKSGQSPSIVNPDEIQSVDNVMDGEQPLKIVYFVCPICPNKYDAKEKVEKHLELFHRMSLEVQKRLGLQSSKQIEEGIIKFKMIYSYKYEL